MPELFTDQIAMLKQERFCVVTGRVIEVTGLVAMAEGLPLPVGSMCEIVRAQAEAAPAQIVGFRDDRAVLMPLVSPLGIARGDAVRSTAAMRHVPVGRRLLGRVLDGLGRPVDDAGPLTVEGHYPVFAGSPRALSRIPIDAPLATGIRCIDGMITAGGGQRMGFFAGTGVGKSVLMGMIARNTAADVSVIALVGERGREVGDFLRRDLGDEGRRRSVMVVSTSDESPVLRVRACFVATAIAEYFRDQGANVLLMMDSLTRMAMAQRQIGLAAGEPPTTKGYPPSVFSLMPQLLERAGRTGRGSITGLYTVLVEGDDINEPISDAARGFLDGHVWLSRSLANRGHYPAVSVLESISRVMADVTDESHAAAARTIRRLMAVWADIEDMVNIGAYTPGANAEYDLVIRMKPKIDAFLRQGVSEPAAFAQSRERLIELAAEATAAPEPVRPATTRSRPSAGRERTAAGAA